MIFRRRVSLRVIFTIAIFLLIILFFTTIVQFNQMDSRVYSASHDANYQKKIESEIDRLRRLEKFRKKHKFGQVDENNNNINNHQQNDFNEYDRVEPTVVDLTFVKAVESMERIVHIDLKGAAPKLTFLKEFIPYIKKLGATGVLIEYEDFFPYANDLETVCNQNHYTRQELTLLFDIISENQLKLIPLIQTYGHMEFVLKLKQYAHLREHKQHYQVISPCMADSYEKVLYKMIDQIIDTHPSSLEYIHIGCDEVYHINVNTACASLSHLKTTEDFFVYHVTKLVNYVKSKRPDLKVMIWDDMIRHNMIANVSGRVMTISDLNLRQEFRIRNACDY